MLRCTNYSHGKWKGCTSTKVFISKAWSLRRRRTCCQSWTERAPWVAPSRPCPMTLTTGMAMSTSLKMVLTLIPTDSNTHSGKNPRTWVKEQLDKQARTTGTRQTTKKTTTVVGTLPETLSAISNTTNLHPTCTWAACRLCARCKRSARWGWPLRSWASPSRPFTWPSRPWQWPWGSSWRRRSWAWCSTTWGSAWSLWLCTWSTVCKKRWCTWTSPTTAWCVQCGCAFIFVCFHKFHYPNSYPPVWKWEEWTIMPDSWEGVVASASATALHQPCLNKSVTLWSLYKAARELSAAARKAEHSVYARFPFSVGQNQFRINTFSPSRANKM